MDAISYVPGRDIRFSRLAMDPRAKHRVWLNGTVKFPYCGYLISVASDGADVEVHLDDAGSLDTYYHVDICDCPGGVVEAIERCREAIDTKLNKG